MALTIFPCSRCGRVPEVKPGGVGRLGYASMCINHECVRGRTYKVEFFGPDLESCRDDCIYRWNESNASDNPAWWTERYDFLHGMCRTVKERMKC